jgi:hypothetical protein
MWSSMFDVLLPKTQLAVTLDLHFDLRQEDLDPVRRD